MSLPLIAKHLEQHGRGEDTHLVHMTTGELKALQKMAEQHGGSLTVNPHTGLPEAGFLSSVLPMALGAVAAATGQEWAVPLAIAMSAGGEYAMTGSLTQGLMAGLGAWGGAGIESGLAGLGAESAVQAGTATGNEAFEAQQAALTQQFPTATPESVNQAALQQSITPQNFPNYSPEQLTQIQAAGTNAADPQQFMQSIGQGNASLGSNITNPTFADSLSNAGKGLTSGNLGSYAMAHLGQVAAVGVPLLSGATSLFKQPTVPTATNTSTNPFGMKTIPKDANGNPIFHASVPTPPNPPYQAQYRDYVANPYIAGAKKGGLMDIPKYSGADYGSMVTGAQEMQQGLAQATSPQQLSELQKELIAAGQESSKNGVYHLSDIEYAKMTPAALMKAHKIAVAKGLQPVGQLGDYEITPAAAIAQADIDKAAQQQTSAKEGGLMAMASGGSPIYHPQYQNYAQTPFNPATAQGYGGIPTPTRSAAMPATGYKMSNITGGTPGGSGAADLYSTLNNLEATAGLPLTQAPTLKPGQIDPSIMIGSPQNNALNAQISKLQAQLTPSYSSDGGGGGGASGGLPKDFKKFAMGGGIQDGHLGSYSDGGRLLKGPGDGVSDGIPATIGGKQPARLADGEFVIPARIVSELGNGSTDAGAKRLYAMMDRIKHARKKSKDIAADTKAYKYLPA